ncbi:MAG: hypothetical protein ACAH59_04940 [Pseudobdellovibrionaceae bacterium]
MSVIFSSRKECYCAFCRSERKVYSKRNIDFTDIIGSALGAITFMFIVFQEADPRALLLFVAFLAVSETFVQIRWRLTIACKYCGFDPVLYLKDTAKAVAKVKMHLDQRKFNPASLLASPLQLPTLSKERAELLEKAQTIGNLVNKRL